MSTLPTSPASALCLCALQLVLAVSSPLTARDWYVSTTGSNANNGNREAPLSSIQAAVDRMAPGDTCWIAEGRYHESITFERSGTPDNPIRLQALPGQEVILDGTEALNGEWTPYKENIYRTSAPKGIEQLFVGKQMMIEARWPNMSFDQAYDRSRWAQSDLGSTHGLILSKAIAETGIDWTGAIACLNVAHQWWTWNRPITDHEAGSNRLEYAKNLVGLCNYDPEFNDPSPYARTIWDDDYFYLFGILEALDAETEWFQDADTGMLYLYAPGGVDPSALDVRYKALNYAVEAQDCDYLEIVGINFFAATLKLTDCDRTLIEDCELLYPSYTRTITEFDEVRRESVFTKIVGDHNTVRHCSIAYTNNLGLMMMGSHNLVEDCIIHDVNWFGTLIYPALQLSASPHLGVNWFDTIQYPPTERTVENSDVTSYGNIARGNTLYNSGSCLIVYHAADSIVEYNHVYDGGLACRDVSLIYGCWPFSRGSIVRYNWVHGCQTARPGGNGGIGIRADDQSRNNTFHHNVVWDIGERGIVLKGEDNRAFNNTVFDIGDGRHTGQDLLLPEQSEPVKIWAVQWPQLLKQNQWSEAANNAARTITNDPKKRDAYEPSDRLHHNLHGQPITPLLEDPANFDFRPKAGSPLVDAGALLPGYNDDYHGSAPDIGAYEYGGEYWIPGANWEESFTKLADEHAVR